MTTTGILTARFTARNKAVPGVRPAVISAVQSSILPAPPRSAATQDSTVDATTSIKKGVFVSMKKLVGPNLPLSAQKKPTQSNTFINMHGDVQITVIDREGISHDIKAPTDMNMNMMELCKSYDLPVEGTCGGMAMCASCHLYVESEHPLLERNDDEEAMLDQAFFVKPNSRLGCQLKITADFDGLVVRLAEVGS